jgi:hypothetical protein
LLVDYYDLGTFGRPVTTSSAQAQLWFDRGLAWAYGFNHEEAVACFEAAAVADPGCAMARWGIAYALGPNYNKPWESFDAADLMRTVERAYAAVEHAHAVAAGATPIEQALIRALRARYPQSRAVDDCSVWNEPYADAMRGVYELAPDDPDTPAMSWSTTSIISARAGVRARWRAPRPSTGRFRPIAHMSDKMG